MGIKKTCGYFSNGYSTSNGRVTGTGFLQCVTHMISQDHSKLDYKKIAKQILSLIKKRSNNFTTSVDWRKKSLHLHNHLQKNMDDKTKVNQESVWSLGGITQTITQVSPSHEWFSSWNNHRFSDWPTSERGHLVPSKKTFQRVF